MHVCSQQGVKSDYYDALAIILFGRLRPSVQGPPQARPNCSPASDIWWPTLETCSLDDPFLYWHLVTSVASTVDERAVRILLQCFLVSKYIYRPQTKFAKVVFLHLSVSHSVHGGWCIPPCNGTDTPQEDRHPPDQCMLGDTGNKRPVRILLECILVSKYIQKIFLAFVFETVWMDLPSSTIQYVTQKVNLLFFIFKYFVYLLLNCYTNNDCVVT